MSNLIYLAVRYILYLNLGNHKSLNALTSIIKLFCTGLRNQLMLLIDTLINTNSLVNLQLTLVYALRISHDCD